MQCGTFYVGINPVTTTQTESEHTCHPTDPCAYCWAVSLLPPLRAPPFCYFWTSCEWALIVCDLHGFCLTIKSGRFTHVWMYVAVMVYCHTLSSCTNRPQLFFWRMGNWVTRSLRYSWGWLWISALLASITQVPVLIGVYHHHLGLRRAMDWTQGFIFAGMALYQVTFLATYATMEGQLRFERP